MNSYVMTDLLKNSLVFTVFHRLCSRRAVWLAAVVLFAGTVMSCREKPLERTDDPAAKPFIGPPAPPPGLLFTFPSSQTHLADSNNPAVFMPTASGRVESAWYGSTRTRKFGKSYLSAFHEGVDIAPIKRDSRGQADDPVFAVANGRIGYINRTAGNSSYGIYVVLLHQSAIGEYYTLYAHLASAGADWKEGDTVTRGVEIGRIGHTSTLGIPVERSHLHFEVGTIFNSRFREWYHRKKMKPDHGTLHGYNLGGLNPMDLFAYMISGERFELYRYMENCPVAYRLLIRVSAVPDYYRRYPLLWTGNEPVAGAMVMDVSEGGVPLRARPATVEEARTLKKEKVHVMTVFPEVLGRNGDRLIVETHGDWIPGRNAAQWLDILLY